MTKKIVKVEDNKKSKLDLDKIKDVIIDNKDTIAKVVDIASELLDDDKKSSKKSSKKTASKKSKKSSKSSDLSTVIDIAEKFLK